MKPVEVTAAELNLGDVIRVTDVFGDAVVRKITITDIYVFRPYATTSDFSYVGGVIPYIGIEEFSIPRSTGATFTLVQKSDPKR
jgi:hypothetical protein